MDQQQFNTIVKLIQVGAPALAEELVSSLQGLVLGYQAAIRELNKLKSEQQTGDKEETPDKKKEAK